MVRTTGDGSGDNMRRVSRRSSLSPSRQALPAAGSPTPSDARPPAGPVAMPPRSWLRQSTLPGSGAGELTSAFARLRASPAAGTSARGSSGRTSLLSQQLRGSDSTSGSAGTSSAESSPMPPSTLQGGAQQGSQLPRQRQQQLGGRRQPVVTDALPQRRFTMRSALSAELAGMRGEALPSLTPQAAMQPAAAINGISHLLDAGRSSSTPLPLLARGRPQVGELGSLHGRNVALFLALMTLHMSIQGHSAHPSAHPFICIADQAVSRPASTEQCIVHVAQEHPGTASAPFRAGWPIGHASPAARRKSREQQMEQGGSRGAAALAPGRSMRSYSSPAVSPHEEGTASPLPRRRARRRRGILSCCRSLTRPLHRRASGCLAAWFQVRQWQWFLPNAVMSCVRYDKACARGRCMYRVVHHMSFTGTSAAGSNIRVSFESEDDDGSSLGGLSM